jgi:hypothetical protein
MQQHPRSNLVRLRDAALWLVLTLALLVASVFLPALYAAGRPNVFRASTAPHEWFTPPIATGTMKPPQMSSRVLPGYAYEILMGMPDTDSPNPAASATVQDRLSIGLPFTSVSRIFSITDPPETPLHTFSIAGNRISLTNLHLSISFRPPRGTTPGSIIQIPTTPFWPGLIANIIFWGFVAWFISSGVKRLRIARRRAKGLCTNCAFPVDQLPRCPECGQPTQLINTAPSNAPSPHP